jgi:hypothetical protein
MIGATYRLHCMYRNLFIYYAHLTLLNILVLKLCVELTVRLQLLFVYHNWSLQMCKKDNLRILINTRLHTHNT